MLAEEILSIATSTTRVALGAKNTVGICCCSDLLRGGSCRARLELLIFLLEFMDLVRLKHLDQAHGRGNSLLWTVEVALFAFARWLWRCAERWQLWKESCKVSLLGWSSGCSFTASGR